MRATNPARRLPIQNVISRGTEELDLIGLLRTLWMGKWLISLFALLAVFLGVLYLSFLSVPTYVATAVVALDNSNEQVAFDFENALSGLANDQSAINTEIEVIKSRKLIGRVVDEMDLMSDPEFNETLRTPSLFSIGAIIGAATELALGPQDDEALSVEDQRIETVDAVIKALSVSNMRQSFVFRISATTEDPIKSRELANTVSNVYLENQLEAKFEATERATNWLAGRVGELKDTLETAEKAVKDFDASSRLVGPEALEVLERQIKDIRERADDAEIELSAAETSLSAVQQANDGPALIAVTDDPILRRLQDADQLESQAFERRKAQILSERQNTVTRISNRLNTLRASVVELSDQIAEQSRDLVQLRQLEREAEASRSIYEYFLSRLKETSVQQGIQQADARILSFAVAPREAASPRKSKVLSGYLLAGLLLGAGIVILRELMQSTYRDSETLESETGCTVIGQIPLMPVKRRGKIKDYIIANPTSAAVEAIRNLRTTLLLQDVDHPPQVILSTSSLPKEGKTTQSIGLAVNLASLGHKVLLVEGDLRRRVFSEYFEIPWTKGLVSVIAGNASMDEVVFTDDTLKIDILQGEATRVNAADLYTSKTFETFLSDMRNRYDFIIFDTPPVLLVPDARIVAQNADSIMYTVKWDSTLKSDVRRGLRQFASVGTPVNGVVLAQINPKGLQGYGYGTYGGSYYEST